MEKMYPSEMRLLLVTRQIKRRATTEKGEGVENYYYRCENVEGKTQKEEEKKGKEKKKTLEAFSVLKREKRKKDFMSTGSLLRFLRFGGGEWDKFYDYYTDIIMLFPRLV